MIHAGYFDYQSDWLDADLRFDLIADLFENGRPSSDSPYTVNSFSRHGPRRANRLLCSVGEEISMRVGLRLNPVCAFMRLYRRGATLETHTDREGLEWTLSLPLHQDAEWPIEAVVGGERQLLTPVEGRGVLMTGRTVPHRRVGRYGGEGNVTLLLHYSQDHRAEYPILVHPTHMFSRGVLDGETIGRIRRAVPSRLAPALTGADGHAHQNRSGGVHWLRRPEWSWLYDLLEAEVFKLNAAAWKRRLRSGGGEEIQFARYREGDFYGWHRDRDPRARGATARRSLSAVVPLCDAQGGGGLEIRNGGVVELGCGDMAVFPSETEHRAVRVTGGTRESLVLWIAEGE